MSCSWRDSARKVIEPIYRDSMALGASLGEFSKALSDAYPFGQRRMHPYKIWCDECKRWKALYANQIAVKQGFIPGPRPVRQANESMGEELSGSLFAEEGVSA